MLGSEEFGKNLCLGRKCLLCRLNNSLDTGREKTSKVKWIIKLRNSLGTHYGDIRR